MWPVPQQTSHLSHRDSPLQFRPVDALTEAEAARYIGMSQSWLRKARCFDRPDQPPYIRITSRSIRYLRTDLDAWLESRRYIPAAA